MGDRFRAPRGPGRQHSCAQERAALPDLPVCVQKPTCRGRGPPPHPPPPRSDEDARALVSSRPSARSEPAGLVPPGSKDLPGLWREAGTARAARPPGVPAERPACNSVFLAKPVSEGRHVPRDAEQSPVVRVTQCGAWASGHPRLAGQSACQQPTLLISDGGAAHDLGLRQRHQPL